MVVPGHCHQLPKVFILENRADTLLIPCFSSVIVGEECTSVPVPTSTVVYSNDVWVARAFGECIQSVGLGRMNPIIESIERKTMTPEAKSKHSRARTDTVYTASERKRIDLHHSKRLILRLCCEIAASVALAPSLTMMLASSSMKKMSTHSFSNRGARWLSAVPTAPEVPEPEKPVIAVVEDQPPEVVDELNKNLKPSEIVDALNCHIVGQKDAKKAVAIAMRNRWRRRQLPDELRKEVTPRNVLLVGPTGRCRKTRHHLLFLCWLY